MKLTNFNTLILMLSASALLALTGCGTTGTSSDEPLAGGVPSIGGLYGTTGAGGGVSNFVMLDATTGEIIETIGNVGYLVNGLEYDKTTDTFFATTSAKDGTCAACLITIDPTDGHGTVIGSSGLGNVLNPTVNSAGEMYGWTENGDDLVTINKETGEATIIGNSGISSWAHGLAFDANDVLWMHNAYDDVYTMNTTTGEGTHYKALDGATDYAHHGDFDLKTGVYAGVSMDDADWSIRWVVFKDSEFNTISTSEHNYTNLHTLTFVN